MAITISLDGWFSCRLGTATTNLITPHHTHTRTHTRFCGKIKIKINITNNQMCLCSVLHLMKVVAVFRLELANSWEREREKTRRQIVCAVWFIFAHLSSPQYCNRFGDKTYAVCPRARTLFLSCKGVSEQKWPNNSSSSSSSSQKNEEVELQGTWKRKERRRF